MISRRHLITTSLGLASALSLTPNLVCARNQEVSSFGFSTWTDEDPYYVFFPGDEIEIFVPSVAELSRKQLVGPDGRIHLPYIAPIMVAYRTIEQVEKALQNAYSATLRRPSELQVMRSTTVPMRVLVGGEVGLAGWVDMGSSDLDAFSAVLAAGGFSKTAKPEKTQLIRRARNGQAMRKTLDMKAFLKGKSAQMTPLRRFDIIFVPRKSVAEAGIFVDQWINGLIPGAVLNYFTFRTFG